MWLLWWALFLLNTQQYIVTLIWIFTGLESLVWNGPISPSLEPALTCPLLDTLQIPFKHTHRQGVPSVQTDSSPLSYISQRYTYMKVLTARNPCIAIWLQVPFIIVSLNKTTSLIHKNEKKNVKRNRCLLVANILHSLFYIRLPCTGFILLTLNKRMCVSTKISWLYPN